MQESRVTASASRRIKRGYATCDASKAGGIRFHPFCDHALLCLDVPFDDLKADVCTHAPAMPCCDGEARVGMVTRASGPLNQVPIVKSG
jgi:hypothetical protein